MINFNRSHSGGLFFYEKDSDFFVVSVELFQ